jgi:hypothetical protein
MDLQNTFNRTGSPTLWFLTLFGNTEVATSSSYNTPVEVGGTLVVRSYTNRGPTAHDTTRHYQPAETTATSARVVRQAQHTCVSGRDRERASSRTSSSYAEPRTCPAVPTCGAQQTHACTCREGKQSNQDDTTL